MIKQDQVDRSLNESCMSAYSRRRPTQKPSRAIVRSNQSYESKRGAICMAHRERRPLCPARSSHVEREKDFFLFFLLSLAISVATCSRRRIVLLRMADLKHGATGRLAQNSARKHEKVHLYRIAQHIFNCTIVDSLRRLCFT